MRIVVCALLLAGCHANTSSLAGAAVMAPLALGASAISRATGGCYAVCQQGEQCNSRNGLCEALPCRGQCPASQGCEETFFGIKCIDGVPLQVHSNAEPATAKQPAAPPAAAGQKPTAPSDAVAPKE